MVTSPLPWTLSLCATTQILEMTSVHFGLGAHSPPVLLEISWPDGEHEMVPTPVGRLITVTQW